MSQSIKDKLRSYNVEILRFTWVGLDGVIRSKGAQVSHVEELIRTGIGVTKAMFSFTPMDIISPYGSFGPQDEDVFIVPDLSTLTVFPPSAIVICEVRDKGKPWEFDLRSKLNARLEKLKEEEGYDVRSSFEMEFYLVKDRKPYDDARCFDSSAFYNNPIISEMIKVLTNSGIDIIRVIKEYGPGQYEFDIVHKNSLRSADEVVIFKEITKQIALSKGIEVNFMPKPFNKLPGSGMHLNISLWREGKNVFYDPKDKYGLSELGYNFIAGLLEHAKALTALVAPTVNSYKRLVPGSWAPTKISYGYNNKSTMIRIPTPYPTMESHDRRVEYRVPDASSNPYLVILAVLEAGLDGIERGLKPGNPVNENAYLRKDIEDIPRNLREALRELDRDNRLKERIGEQVVREFINIKSAEVEEFESIVTDWEYEVYRKI
ncbi:glutamine synthetase family protein [Sulfolobus acidocaldarius]|uniref:Glutamine synthetase n=4 Tax=Sulfolobus acidocaldarius TaxID=2285 RepID=Q4J6Z7_SULAC|nr:glutamine synthetase family protein [Sulfolobus acidocaldarius]AAY81434.1 glutamine synthetase [Sulfolobus acidocaldarius DSM 639]AGE72034.1 glutamate--ammonia ligase [Sulfolobus acidocaldarius N8]AGE74351.1 glutamate--ammonia ligase [Sulfolobus acidocaldarius Ron12/I]ALU29777.1 glutamate--ammonia ligase [Sulfolobus acidocaldarius]ALU32515.1 glutamate--ammonia ligase [Sulfolobus acidocaldarius]